MIMSKFGEVGVRRNRGYCKARSIWPIVATKGGPMQDRATHSSNLKKAVKKPIWKAQLTAPWISEATWRLADQRTALMQSHVIPERSWDSDEAVPNRTKEG